VPDVELLSIARAVTAQAVDGEQLEAYVSRGRETSVRAFEGKVESLASAESAGIGVRVVRGGRVGFAWVGALGEAPAREALEQARDNAAYSTEDPHAGLAEPDGVESASLDLWRDELAESGPEPKIALALELERRTRSADSRIRQVVSADYSDALREAAVATSSGIEVSSRRTTCVLSVSAVAGEGDDTRTGSGYSTGRHLDELDIGHACDDAVQRATRLLGARKPRSRRLPVVLDPRVTATFLSVIAGTLSGDEVVKGRSLFAGRVGEEVAVPTISLLDDPTDPASLGATPYDAEGLACRRNRLIEGGKLLGYLYDTHAGRVAGSPSTASAVRGGYRTTPGVGARAVAIEPGSLEPKDVLAAVGDGLFVQSVSGVHSGVNPVSGDFSVGADGLLIRGGALVEPVRELTIASTIQRMLQHVVAIGCDLEWMPGSAAGLTLAIDDVSMSGS
jgi:PmbA protein